MTTYIAPPVTLKPGSIVWAYLRDSGGDGQEQSVPQQKAEIEKYCEVFGLRLAHVFADVAKSGGSVAGRDSFNDMTDMATDPELRPAGLLIWNHARFARDQNDANFYKASLRRMGVVVHSLTDPIPDGHYGRLVENLIDFTNEEKRKQTSRDVKRALEALVRQGYSSGGFPPRGYMAEKHRIGTKRDGQPRIVSKWIRDPEKWELVRLAWRMRAEGRSYNEITKATKGKLYKSKNCWPTFFTNKTYLGIGKCGDLEIPDHHEAAVTKETWDAVQEQKKASPWYGKTGHPHHPRRKKYQSLFSGLAVCYHCGTSIIHHNAHKNRPWRFYICGKKDRQKKLGNCEARRVGAKKAEDAILDTVLNRVLTPTYFEELLAELQTQFEDTKAVNKEITEKRAELREIEQAIQNLLDLAETFGAGAAVERLKKREVEKADLLTSLRQLEGKREMARVEVTPDALSLALGVWRDQLREKANSGNIPETKRMLRRFVEKVELGYKKANLWYTYPIDNNVPFRVYSGGGTRLKKLFNR